MHCLPCLERERLCPPDKKSAKMKCILKQCVCVGGGGVWVCLKVLVGSESSAPLMQVSPDTPKVCNGQTAKRALGGMCNAQQPERPGEPSGRGFPAKGNVRVFCSH